MLALESKEDCINHVHNIPKIYKPKAKKLFSSYKPQTSHNKKKDSNKKHSLTPNLNFNGNFNFNKEFLENKKNKKEIKHSNKRPKLHIEKISFKEMADDFLKLKEIKENKKAEKELLYLLRNSTKDDSQDEFFKETDKVKRPKNPLLQNFE